MLKSINFLYPARKKGKAMKALVARFTDAKNKGDSLFDILLYWLPELVSATILITLPPIVDAWIVTRLGSTTIYGACGMGNNFLHMLIKISEAIPVAAIAMMGRYNGAKDYEKCGQTLGDTFWTTVIFGLTQFLIILFGAHAIYRWLGVPPEMVAHGAPFLQLKSFGVFLIFTALGFVAFMRAVKNTRMPMILNIISLSIFLFLDYGLVLGEFGLPQIGLCGSAIATIIQYSVMNIIALSYILFNPEYKKYFTVMFFSIFNPKRALHLLNLSWPIMIDKMAIASSYVWLSKMIAPLGKYAIATYDVVKNLERFAFLPVMASAVIITFLVSNRLGSGDLEGATANIKKTFLFTSGILLSAIMVLCINARYFVSYFDPQNQFTDFASAALPLVSMLVVFDFMQVFFAGALRGAGDVKVVMRNRVVACFGFFIPLSYGLSKLPIESQLVKFVLIYGSFYVTTGIIGVSYLYRIKSRAWQKQKV